MRSALWRGGGCDCHKDASLIPVQLALSHRPALTEERKEREITHLFQLHPR